jgi:uncharacterized protein
MGREFEWDNPKARTNLRDHGASFELARRAFDDPFSILLQDRIEGNEVRWQTLGMAGGVILLLVAHTIIEWDDDIEIIRIISARHADRSEKKRYEQNRQNILRH